MTLIFASAVRSIWVAIQISRLAKDPRFAPEPKSVGVVNDWRRHAAARQSPEWRRIMQEHWIWMGVMALGVALIIVAIWPTFREIFGGSYEY